MCDKNKIQNKQQWTSIVSAEDTGFEWRLKNLLPYKDLLFVLVKKDLHYSFKQTFLGPLWIILNPLISTLIFALVLGFFAKVQTDSVPIILFYLTGGIMFNYFSNAFTSNANALIANNNILSKVYIPCLILPLASSITALIKFLLVVAVSTPVFIYYFSVDGASPNAWLLAFPLLVSMLFLLAFGMGLIFSALMLQRRDLGVLLPFLTSILMFVTPVLYPISLVPQHLLKFYLLNPLAGIIECFRYGITGAGNFMPYMLLSSAILSVGALLIGVLLFRKVNHKIPDYI